MRLFIGIPLAPVVVEELAALTERLKSPSDGLRWSAAAGWHITLQFLGKTSTEQYACVVPALRRILFSPLQSNLSRRGSSIAPAFSLPEWGSRPGWCGFRNSWLRQPGPAGLFPRTGPIIRTLRWRGPKPGRSALAALKPRIGHVKQFSGFTAREFLLYESFPGPGGSRYETRDRFVLEKERKAK